MITFDLTTHRQETTRELDRAILECFGAKPSISEDRGLLFLRPDDLHVLSAGISTAGAVEVRMALSNPLRQIVATTIDKQGLAFTQNAIQNIGLQSQIETKLEDLRECNSYPPDSFDYIYARLVLHYLSIQHLDFALSEFFRVLKSGGRLFIAVKSVKNIPQNGSATFDEHTGFTSFPVLNGEGKFPRTETRCFHTPDSIRAHVIKAGFFAVKVEEYDEQLYDDYLRKELAVGLDHLIEVRAEKP